jgi:predicted esterase
MSRVLVVCLAFVLAALTPMVPSSRAEHPTGELVEGVACQKDPTQTYTLYLPSGYDASTRWPVLLVFDPRGRSVLAAELFRDAAEEHGWIIVSSNDTRSDGPMEPNIAAINALWPEVHLRLPIDTSRVYAAGFSGGAHLAYGLGKGTGELAGIVACGGRFFKDSLEDTSFALFGAAGTTDFNYRHMRTVDEFLEQQGNRHRLEIFEGTHTWMPPELARLAVEFMEIDAIRRGTRTRDDELVARLYGADMKAAEDLEESGDELAAMRRYRSIVTTFGGVWAVDEPERRAERLEGSLEVRRAIKEEAKCDRYEVRRVSEFDEVMADLRFAEDDEFANNLERDFRLSELQRRTEGDGCQAVTAQRLLDTAYAFTSFYLPRDFFDEGRYERAAASLEVAVSIRQDNPIVWYNLACARARSGDKKEAVEALGQSIAHGFRNLDHIESDADLESIRARDDYREVVRALREEEAPG